MPNTREKLIELLESAESAIYWNSDDNSFIQKIADHLIANGVTVQEWIPVTERLPQEDEPLGATCEQVQVLLDNGVVSTGWCNRGLKVWWHLNYGETHFIGYDYERTPVIAWQPLSQPPKEG